MSAEPHLPDLLAAQRAALLRYVRRRAGRLTRYESAEDLLQGIHLRALEREAGFEYRGEAPFAAWIRTVARNYLADRIAYWTALRRQPAAILRLTAGATADGQAVGTPPGDWTGPATFAERREQIEAAVRALDLLLPRDREILRLASRGHAGAALARQLGLSEPAAEKARQRALTRFRKAYALTTG